LKPFFESEKHRIIVGNPGCTALQATENQHSRALSHSANTLYINSPSITSVRIFRRHLAVIYCY